MNLVVLNLLSASSFIRGGQLALVGLAPTSPLISGASQLVDSDLHGTGAIALPVLVCWRSLPYARVFLFWRDYPNSR